LNRCVVRFLADADLDRAIVTACRRAEPTLDFLVASDAGLKGWAASDAEEWVNRIIEIPL
jgi:hypothetical protein